MIIRALPSPVMALDRLPFTIKGMAFDRIAQDASSVRTKDRDGRLHISTTHISKASVDPYYGEEIPDAEELGLDPKKIYYLFRSPEELEAAAPTFDNLPLLSKHIPVSAKAPQKEITVGSLGTDASFSDPYLDNSLVVYDQDAIDGIEDKSQRELSCGYYYTADMTPGIFGGLRYDGIMRNIVGNHVALVDAGRAGPDVVVGDQMPGGLNMLKSKTALMLNGALLGLIAPKMAQDKKLDLSKVLAGVKSTTIAKDQKGLASKIMAATKGKLAQDADLDADDVVKVIGAITGSTADVTEDEDMIPDEAEVPAVDGDDDVIAKIMAALKGKISDEDMAAIGKIAGGQAADDDGDDMGEDDEDGAAAPPEGDKPPVKPAMDAKTVRAYAGALVAEIRQAEREVAPLIGEVKVACDSGAAVYKLALDHLKIDLKGVPKAAFGPMVRLAVDAAKLAPKAAIAMDRAGAASDFSSRFADAGKLIAN